MRRIICIALLVLLTSCLAYAADVSENTPNLNAPVTVAVKGYSLEELAAMLQEQTGVSLKVDRDIADNKVTVFVDDKPLIQVMNGLETLFQYKWYREERNGKKSYQFSNPSKAKRQTAYGESVNELWSKLDKELAKISEGLNNRGSDPESRRAYQTAVLASFISKFPAPLQEAFLNEYTICFHTESPEPEWVLPSNETKAMAMLATANVQRMGPDGMVIDLADTSGSSKTTVGLSIRPIIEFDDTGINISVSAASQISNKSSDDAGRISESNVTTNTRLFPQSIHIDSKAPVNHLPKTNPAYLADKITLTTDEISKESDQQSEWNGIPANRSDILALLHKKANIQIIADHYSQWNGWTAINDVTVKDIIEEMSKQSPTSFTGCDENYLFMKNMYPFRSNIRETPNRVLRPLQEASKEMKSFGLDQIADMVTLGNDKFMVLQNNTKYLKLAFLPEQTMFIINCPAGIALEIYGILTLKQRQSAFSTGLSASILTPDQRYKLAALIDSLNTSNFPGDTPPTVRVGIFKDNIRIDKKLPLPTMNIAFLKMIKEYEATGFSMPAANMVIPSVPSAPERTAKVDGYTLIIQYTDGTISKTPIPLLVVQ